MIINNYYNFLKVKLQGHTTAEYAAFRRHFSVGLNSFAHLTQNNSLLLRRPCA